MKKRQILFWVVSFATCLLFLNASSVYSAPVYPDSGLWINDPKNTSTQPLISRDQPRDGNASLKLVTSTPYTDWSFYVRESGNNTSGFGYLSEISGLSFDWYRQTPINLDYELYDPWNIQTPVLRLLIKDGEYLSELVWEKYYTDSSHLNMKIGEWVEQDLIDENFWRRTDGKGYTISSGSDMQNFGTNTLMALSTSSWANSENLGIDYDYSNSAFIYGLSVGVGSQWPGSYTGYVDNIFLEFTGDNQTYVSVDDNFELRDVNPVPEPATLLLLGSGMAVLGARNRWRKKIRQS
jgi:hypothetical protein